MNGPLIAPRPRSTLSVAFECATEAMVIVDSAGRVEELNRAATTLLGKDRADVLGRCFTEILNDPVLRTCENIGPMVPAVGADCIVQHNGYGQADGTQLRLEIRFASAGCADDGSLAQVAFLRRQSDEHLADTLARVEYALTRAVAVSASTGAAIREIFQVLGVAIGFSFGLLWEFESRARVFRVRETFAADGFDATGFEAKSRATSLKRGEGLPGEAARSRAPMWFKDIARSDHPHAHAATAAGLRSAIVLPLRVGAQLRAVAEFYFDQVKDEQPALTATIERVLRQLGDVLGRMHIEEERDRFFSLGLDLFSIFTLDGYFRRLNPRWESTLGHSQEELIATPILEFLHQDDVESTRAQFDNLAKGLSASFENRFRCSDGSYRIFAWTCSAPSPGDEIVYAVARDVTAAKRQELEARHSQKLESVGRLAAGIAHELNTPIQFVGDTTEFLRTSFRNILALVATYREFVGRARGGVLPEPAFAAIDSAEGDSDIEYLTREIPRAFGEVTDGIGHIASIVRAMQRFSYEGSAMVAADVNKALEDTLTILRNELRATAEVETNLGCVPPIVCDIGSLKQVFLNVLVNAADAVGAVTARTGKRGRIAIRTFVRDNQAVIAVEDTGGGIPQEIQRRIFDHFFTTKEVGKGTGQGLALARTIVQDRHRGNLRFETEVGSGTTFYIELPLLPTMSDGRMPQ